MGSGKKVHRHDLKHQGFENVSAEQKDTVSETDAQQKLEIVLKCDTSGSIEALNSAIDSVKVPGVAIDIISSGVGDISKSDIFMAEMGSRLIIGFAVGLMPHMDQLVIEHNIEIRLFAVIYRVLEDVAAIAGSLIPPESTEEIIGSARVIALFKSSRKGIIIGCEVIAGKLAVGNSFRILGAMGPLYSGTIESLHIEKDAVSEAKKGQRTGLKIKDFHKVRVGDLVESYRLITVRHDRPWQPQGKIYYP
jgi:translation initiation factor IF-2